MVLDLLTHQRQQQKQRRSPLRSGAHPHQVRTALNNSVVSPATEEVSIANATGSNVVDYPMSAVLVVAKDKTVTNVTAGDFTAPATFTVTYN